MKNIDIARPLVKDTASIHDFFEIVLKDTFERNGLSEMKETLAEEIEEKKRCLKQDNESKGQDRYFLIAKDGGKIVGSIEYGPSNDLIISCTQGKLVGVAEVGTVFVHPTYQNQGIGSRLMTLLLTEMQCRGMEEFCLDSGYPSAQKTWTRKFGLPEYHLKDYWAEGADHMVWRVKIEDMLSRGQGLCQLL